VKLNRLEKRALAVLAALASIGFFVLVFPFVGDPAWRLALSVSAFIGVWISLYIGFILAKLCVQLFRYLTSEVGGLAPPRR
jgi:hypothetical protein